MRSRSHAPSTEDDRQRAYHLFREGKVQKARRLCEKILRKTPNDSFVLGLLGAVLFKSKDFGGAAVTLEKAIVADPNNLDAINNLGVVLNLLERYADAARISGRAVELGPNSAEHHHNHGIALKNAGQASSALEAFRRAEELDPRSAEAINQQGVVLRALGRSDEAIECYRRSLRVQPRFAETYRLLANVRTFTERDDDIRKMERLLADPGSGAGDVMRLCFALGKAYEDIKDYDDAFRCFERGNKLRRESFEYDVGEDETKVQRIAQVFDSDLFERHRNEGCPSDVPIFVLGMPRSGTTLVEQILASHSKVFGAGELGDVERLAGSSRFGSGARFPENARQLKTDAFRALGDSYVAGLRSRGTGQTRITDKMPQNFFFIGLIHLIVPAARIIRCVRDPVDTCLSCYLQFFGGRQPFAWDLTELGRYYRAYQALMDHWASVLPGRILEVRYEDLVADTETESRRLIDHCGLAWEDGCLAFQRTDRPVLTASASQVRRGIYTSSVARWRRYERHLGPLIEALGPAAATD